MLSGAGHRRHRGARNATEQDVEALANLMTELGYQSTVEERGRRLARIYANPSYAALVAERDGLVVGMAGVHGEGEDSEDALVHPVELYAVTQAEPGKIGRRSSRRS